jgi:hypothetical protein
MQSEVLSRKYLCQLCSSLALKHATSSSFINLGFHQVHSSIEHPHQRQLSHGLEIVSAAGKDGYIIL